MEMEHFIPRSVQNILGPVDIEGMPWQQGSRIQLLPGRYALGRVLCKKHHDDLDLLDPVARNLFSNLRLIADGNLRPGVPGRATDWTMRLDGRLIERWMLKTVCGAIATNNIDAREAVRDEWLRALFGHVQWPDQYALHVLTDYERRLEATDGAVRMFFHWANEDGRLLGMGIASFGFAMMFDLEAPIKYVMPKRPAGLGARVQRPNGAPVLEGWPVDRPLEFTLEWPTGASRDSSSSCC